VKRKDGANAEAAENARSGPEQTPFTETEEWNRPGLKLLVGAVERVPEWELLVYTRQFS